MLSPVLWVLPPVVSVLPRVFYSVNCASYSGQCASSNVNAHPPPPPPMCFKTVQFQCAYVYRVAMSVSSVDTPWFLQVGSQRLQEQTFQDAPYKNAPTSRDKTALHVAPDHR